MPVCREGTELDYLSAPGNSRVVSSNGINRHGLKFSAVSPGEINGKRREINGKKFPSGRVCVGFNLEDKERPVKSDDSFGSCQDRRWCQSILVWSPFPHTSLANSVKWDSCVRRSLTALSSRHKAAQTFFSCPVPLLFTHWYFWVLNFLTHHH